MSTMHVIDGQRGETRTEAVARRLREKLAGINVSRRELSRRLNEGPNWATERANGKRAISVEDLDRIEAATGISAVYLFTGLNAENRRPDGPDGGSETTYTPRDSNPEPTVSSSARTARAPGSSNVVPLAPRRTLVPVDEPRWAS